MAAEPGAAAPPWSALERGLRGAVCGAALGFAATYLAVVALRIGYPFELEWMEGGMLAHVERLLDGRPLYAPPTLDFVAFLYPPLYYYAGALTTILAGENLQALRALSFASSLVVLWLLFELVRRETRSAFAALFTAGLFVASYQRSGAWLDLARADSFYLMWLLASIVLLCARPTRAGAVAAGLALACAFFVKQSVALVAAPVALAVWYADRARALAFVGSAGLAIAAAVLALELTYDGWFLYYTFTVPRAHPVAAQQVWAFWTLDLLPLGVAAFAGLAYAIWTVVVRSDRERFFFPLLLLGLCASSWSVRSLVGAHTNNLFPVFAGIAITGGLALEAGLRVAVTRRERIGLLALAFAQLAMLIYDPRVLIPTEADEVAGRQLVERIAAIEGDVYIPNHGYLARLAGKRAFAHTLAIDNLLLDDLGPPRQMLEADFLRQMQSGRFTAMIVESDRRYEEWARAFFGSPEPVFAREDVFFPVSGGRIRPETLYWRR